MENDYHAIKNRIQGLRRVRAGDLKPNSRNWRVHLTPQRQALRQMLDRLGFIAAVIARPVVIDGEEHLELVDGHLRASLDPETILPVLVVDLDEDETNEALVSLDPLKAMAGVDSHTLNGLLADLPDTPHLQQELQRLIHAGQPSGDAKSRDNLPDLKPQFDVLVKCESETELAELYGEMLSRGYSCRLFR